MGYAVVFTVLAGAAFLLVRPIIRSTDDLTSTAQAYAEGRLDARVDVRGTNPLARLSSQFNRMAAEIQHRIQEQEVMTTAISHELKTPLTRLRLALDMALSSDDDAQLRDMRGSWEMLPDGSYVQLRPVADHVALPSSQTTLAEWSADRARQANRLRRRRPHGPVGGSTL